MCGESPCVGSRRREEEAGSGRCGADACQRRGTEGPGWATGMEELRAAGLRAAVRSRSITAHQRPPTSGSGSALLLPPDSALGWGQLGDV